MENKLVIQIFLSKKFRSFVLVSLRSSNRREARERYTTVWTNETETASKMREKIFKYSTLSFILINFWTLYLFFDYFTEKSGVFYGLGLFIKFAYSVMYAVGFGCFLLVIRLIFYLRKNKNPLKINFFYIFCGIFNLNIFIVWLICLVLKILEIDNGFLTLLMIGTFLISSFIITDIYNSSYRITRK